MNITEAIDVGVGTVDRQKSKKPKKYRAIREVIESGKEARRTFPTPKGEGSKRGVQVGDDVDFREELPVVHP